MVGPRGLPQLIRIQGVLATLMLTAAAPAVRAEVTAAAAGGFTTRKSVTVALPAAAAYQQFLQIGRWWNMEHSYSRDSASLTLKAEPGGCFCERLPDGGFVEHLHVLFAWPGKLLRLQGGLGPLQGLGASGVMSVEFAPAGAGTQVTVTYTVSGFAPGEGLAELAPPVDAVLSDQLERYRQASAAR